MFLVAYKNLTVRLLLTIDFTHFGHSMGRNRLVTELEASCWLGFSVLKDAVQAVEKEKSRTVLYRCEP